MRIREPTSRVDSVAPESFRDGRGALALPVEVDDLGVIQRDRTAFVNPFGLRCLYAEPLAFFDEAKLHLGDHIKDPSGPSCLPAPLC